MNETKQPTAEEVLNYHCHLEKHPHNAGQVVYSTKDSVIKAMEEYATLRNQQQWIVVSEETKKDIRYADNTILLFDNGEIRRFAEENWPFAVVTHYMPLPSPPNQ